jgi:flavorubredoxin
MTERLESIGFEMPQPDITVKFRPDQDELAACYEWGAAFGRLVLAKGEGQ